MPNLSDIPEELLDVKNQADFLLWLGDQPIEINHRRELAFIWADANKTRFSKGELDVALAEHENNDGNEEPPLPSSTS